MHCWCSIGFTSFNNRDLKQGWPRWLWECHMTIGLITGRKNSGSARPECVFTLLCHSHFDNNVKWSNLRYNLEDDSTWWGIFNFRARNIHTVLTNFILGMCTYTFQAEWLGVTFSYQSSSSLLMVPNHWMSIAIKQGLTIGKKSLQRLCTINYRNRVKG